MKVAIPLFDMWVSPRFGFSPELWVVTVEDGRVINQTKLSMIGLTLLQWFNHISSLEIDTLICGGIDGFCQRQLEMMKISVISDVTGEADEVLKLFLKGELKPGFRKYRRRRGKGCKKALFGVPPWVRYKDK